MRKLLFFILVGMFLSPFFGLHAAEDCVSKALTEATNKCYMLCPAACKEPLYRPLKSESEEDCKGKCRVLCGIKEDSVVEPGTPWITQQAIEDSKSVREKCEGKVLDKNAPVYETWQGVSPSAGIPTP